MNADLIKPKPHFHILDGLRGVAAIMVVAFHICEAHATSHQDQIINHGYLAVDFFFLLSGYVIGYAYDDRWDKLTLGGFFKRRLVRLQPMVVMGSIVGAIFFYFQKGDLWPMIATVPVWKMLLVMLIGATLIPIPVRLDIRGWQEMHPLDGPAWSLFFEYLANIFYGVLIRKFSKTALSVLVVIAAGFLVHLAVFGKEGDVIGGWSITAKQLHIGFTRLMFPFFAGLLLSRTAKLTQVKNAFLWCSLLVIAMLAMPRIGSAQQLWMNGIYESVAIIFIFPIIIYLGASGNIENAATNKVAKFFGDLSYPIYITHYPLVYTYTAWVLNNKKKLGETWPMALLVMVSAIVLAWLCLKLYDEPVRKWLQRKVKM